MQMPAIIVTMPTTQKAILKIILCFITVVLTLGLVHTSQQNIDLPFKQALIILDPVFFAGSVGKDQIVKIIGLTGPGAID